MRRISLLFFACLSLFFMSEGFASNKVLCPSADLARQTAEYLDTVWLINSKEYNIYSQEEELLNEGRFWIPLVWATGTQDFNTAFNGAKEKVRSIVKQVNEYAYEDEISYKCGYLDSNDQPAAALVAFNNGADNDIKKVIKLMSKKN